MVTVQVLPEPAPPPSSQPPHVTDWSGGWGCAVSVTTVAAGKGAWQLPLEQLIPAGLLVTLPWRRPPFTITVSVYWTAGVPPPPPLGGGVPGLVLGGGGGGGVPGPGGGTPGVAGVEPGTDWEPRLKIVEPSASVQAIRHRPFCARRRTIT